MQRSESDYTAFSKEKKPEKRTLCRGRWPLMVTYESRIRKGRAPLIRSTKLDSAEASVFNVRRIHRYK